VFERFTERARQVVVHAQDEARALGHAYIGTEHLLLGLLREEEGLAARVLDSLDITLDEVRAQVGLVVGRGEEVSSGQIPFTPSVKKVLELALREALSLGHNYIGTEHILLGLVDEPDGVAVRILLDFGADAETIRNEMIRLISRPAGKARRRPYSPEAERALVSARSRARTEGHSAVGPEHLLLGLAEIDRVREVLRGARFQLGEARVGARSRPVGLPVQPPEGSFTAQAARVLAFAQEEAALAGHSAVGAADILLGLLDETASPATRLLFGIGERADALRQAVLEASRGPGDVEAL
jgi:ATP-dependent Clp protease ATP-binding subunit ClpA